LEVGYFAPVVGIDVSTLEPAERDPAKLRKTALIIIAIAFTGAILVIWAYRIKTANQSDRPPIVTRLKSNFGAINQDGTTVHIGQLEGGVWLTTAIALADKERSRDSLRVMKALAEKYSPEEVNKFVCFTIDPNNDTPEKLAEFAEAEGLTSDRWWFLAAGEKPIRGYVKDKLLLGTVVDETKEGVRTLKFPSIIGVIDQHRHLRGRFDFYQAREVAESAQKLLREEPERAEEFLKDFGRRPEEFLDEEKELQGHLERAIDFILTEDLETK